MKPQSIVLPLAAVVIALGIAASEPPETAPEWPDTEFIAGTWRGVDGETLIEEIWSGGECGQMIGVFRMMSGGEPRFYELMTIEPDGDGWVMYLRHFSPGLKAWEDKEGALVFDLIEAKEGRAVFDQRGADTNLIYERTSDRMTVSLEKLVDGEWERTEFKFERQ